MSDDAALLRLAASVGIETRYSDAWNRDQTVPRAVIEALLAAMGVAAETGEAPAFARAGAEAREARLCPPVVVVPAEAEFVSVPVVSPAEGKGRRLEWHVTHESGATHEGATAIDELPVDGAGERSLRLPSAPLGYGVLALRCGDREDRASLVIAPSRCYLPEDLADEHFAWGLMAQVYALRSPRNWGIGDFTDLARLAEGAGRRGARVIGVNPLHALFAAEPRHISPYSPSSRLFLNTLYIDATAVPDFADCAASQAHAALSETHHGIEAARRAALVDHAALATLKQTAFAQLYSGFRARHLGPSPNGALTARGEAFRAFQRDGGAALRRFAVFEALHEFNLAAGRGFAWRQWDIGLRDPLSPEVQAFVATRSERIEYFEYLQWEADRQLAAAARAGRDAGLSLGLYRDLAVGVDPNGADAWADQELLVTGATIGAPPDPLNLKGQDWGLAPVNPLVLRRGGYASFIASLRANMRHAGALRFDHAMALRRLYWVPQGAKPTEGAYVSYPFADLVRVLALESHRCRCAVIGEDLGTVPEGFREQMRAADILSCRVLLFEREPDGGFAPPERYPELAAASVGTHDLATLRGFWVGRDLEWRRRLDLYATPEQRTAEAAERAADRRRLIDALRRAGVLPCAEKGPVDDSSESELLLAISEGVHRFLGRSAARLVLVRLEDVLGETEQSNLPGTRDEHPNWRRKLSLAIDEMLRDERFRKLTRVLGQDRAWRSAAGRRR